MKPVEILALDIADEAVAGGVRTRGRGPAREEAAVVEIAQVPLHEVTGAHVSAAVAR